MRQAHENMLDTFLTGIAQVLGGATPHLPDALDWNFEVLYESRSWASASQISTPDVRPLRVTIRLHISEPSPGSGLSGASSLRSPHWVFYSRLECSSRECKLPLQIFAVPHFVLYCVTSAEYKLRYYKWEFKAREKELSWRLHYFVVVLSLSSLRQERDQSNISVDKTTMRIGIAEVRNDIFTTAKITGWHYFNRA